MDVRRNMYLIVRATHPSDYAEGWNSHDWAPGDILATRIAEPGGGRQRRGRVSVGNRTSSARRACAESFDECADGRNGLAAKRRKMRKRDSAVQESADFRRSHWSGSFCASCAFSRRSRLPGVDIWCSPIVEPGSVRQRRGRVSVPLRSPQARRACADSLAVTYEAPSSALVVHDACCRLVSRPVSVFSGRLSRSRHVSCWGNRLRSCTHKVGNSLDFRQATIHTFTRSWHADIPCRVGIAGLVDL